MGLLQSKALATCSCVDIALAVTNMGANTTFNAALAKLLNGTNDAALNTLEASDAKATAAGYYLKAIIGARNSDKQMALDNLKVAIEKDSSLKAKAAVDVEFLSMRDDSEFTALVK